MKKTLIIALAALCLSGECDPQPNQQVNRVQADVQLKPDGLTTEQSNVKRRLEEDNKPGSIKYIYCISPYSGEVIFQSSAKGKITSSGKRLNPYSVTSQGGQYVSHWYSGMPVVVNGRERATNEVLQDDGTYGSSIEYLYWWDVNDVYHQHYITGGQIFIVRDQPMVVNRVSIDLNLNSK